MRHATIRERRVLTGLNSASGLEHVGDSFYIIGDDSPFLFRLDEEWRTRSKTPLLNIEMRDAERIAKGRKPDLEALCCLEWQSEREILCFGSGSKSPERDVCFRVNVTEAEAPRNVRRVDMTALYNSLRADLTVVGTQTLNLEAACSTNDSVCLFQRGNISGRNTIIQYNLAEFIAFLDAPAAPAPAPQRVTAFVLPQVKGRWAGFSAATTFQDVIWFSAAVEDTDNEIDDGAKLGSFIGQIRENVLEWITPVPLKDAIAPVKIEGISVLAAGEDFVELAAVTDDDEGASEVLWIEVR